MNSPRSENKFQWKQWLATFAASSPMLGIYLDVVWCSQIDVVQDVNGWLFANAILLIIGAIIGAIIADNFGRKRSFIAMSLLVIPALLFVFIHVCFDLPMLTLIFIKPLVSGIICVLVPLYISEISGPNNCENLMVVPLIVHFFGLFLMNTTYVLTSNSQHIKIFTSATVFVLSILFHVITICVCPETPQYLNWKERYQETGKSLAFFKGITQVEPGRYLSNPTTNTNIINDEGQECCRRFREIFKFGNRRNLAIIASLIAIRRASGQEMNSEVLYQMVDPSYSSDYIGSNPFPLIALHISFFIISIIVMLTVRLYAKKPSLLFVIAVYLIVTFMGVIHIESYWVIAGVYYAQYLCQMIVIAVTLAYIGDSFPINIRAIAIAVLIIFEVLMRSLFTLIYSPTDADVRQLDYSSDSLVLGLLKCGVVVSGFFYFLIFFPKTRNKSPSSIIAFEILPNEEFTRVQLSAPGFAI